MKKVLVLSIVLILIFSIFAVPLTINADDESIITYEKTEELTDGTYIAITVNDKTIGFRRNELMLAEAKYADERLIPEYYCSFRVLQDDSGFKLINESSAGNTCLELDEDGLRTVPESESSGSWQYAEGYLSYIKDESILYLGITDDQIIAVTDQTQAALITLYFGDQRPPRPAPPVPRDMTDPLAPIITDQPEVIPYVIEGSAYEAPSLNISARLPSNEAGDIFFEWYLNGNLYSSENTDTDENGSATSSIIIPELQNQDYGVYPIYCKAGTYDEQGNYHSINSYTVNFIVCRGIADNSVFTFSDLHESWDNIGTTLNDIMDSNHGFLPGLVIATGDYNSNYVAGNIDSFIRKCIDEMIDRIALQLSGLDTIWVSGNHDNGYAAALYNANENSALGVSADYSDIDHNISGTGIIFDTRSDDYLANAQSSRQMGNGLIVIGINYEDLGSLGAYEGKTNGRPDSALLTYGNAQTPNTVYTQLLKALDDIANNYHGETVIISAHAGLHAVGVDPISIAAGASAWGGGQDYSITDSDEVCRLINDYAETYDMDIIFMFGHDHTRREAEFCKLPGDIIYATDHSDEGTYEEITLAFTYGQAGYITGSFSGHKCFTYLTFDDEAIYKNMLSAGSSAFLSDLSKTIKRRYHEAEPEPQPIEPEPEPIKPQPQEEETKEETIIEVITRYTPPITGIDLRSMP